METHEIWILVLLGIIAFESLWSSVLPHIPWIRGKFKCDPPWMAKTPHNPAYLHEVDEQGKVAVDRKGKPIELVPHSFRPFTTASQLEYLGCVAKHQLLLLERIHAELERLPGQHDLYGETARKTPR